MIKSFYYAWLGAFLSLGGACYGAQHEWAAVVVQQEYFQQNNEEQKEQDDSALPDNIKGPVSQGQDELNQENAQTIMSLQEQQGSWPEVFNGMEAVLVLPYFNATARHALFLALKDYHLKSPAEAEPAILGFIHAAQLNNQTLGTSEEVEEVYEQKEQEEQEEPVDVKNWCLQWRTRAQRDGAKRKFKQLSVEEQKKRLEEAVHWGDMKHFGLVCEAIAKPNTAQELSNGKNALHIAVEQGDKVIVLNLLLMHNPLPTLKDMLNKTDNQDDKPLDIAVRNRDIPIMLLLTDSRYRHKAVCNTEKRAYEAWEKYLKPYFAQQLKLLTSK